MNYIILIPVWNFRIWSVNIQASQRKAPFAMEEKQ
jgi:hypothetical protein